MHDPSRREFRTGNMVRFNIEIKNRRDPAIHVLPLRDTYEDAQGASIPNASDQFDYFIDCNCISNADCYDGLFCNGHETCLATGAWESSGDPCDANETCNEETDSCDAVGDDDDYDDEAPNKGNDDNDSGCCG